MQRQKRIQIYVIKLVGGHIALDVEPTDTIDCVKRMIEDKMGPSPMIQRLTFGGKALKDGWRTLQEYKVRNNSTLQLTLGVLGGAIKRNVGGSSGDRHSRRITLQVIAPGLLPQEPQATIEVNGTDSVSRIKRMLVDTPIGKLLQRSHGDLLQRVVVYHRFKLLGDESRPIYLYEVEDGSTLTLSSGTSLLPPAAARLKGEAKIPTLGGDREDSVEAKSMESPARPPLPPPTPLPPAPSMMSIPGRPADATPATTARMESARRAMLTDERRHEEEAKANPTTDSEGEEEREAEYRTWLAQRHLKRRREREGGGGAADTESGSLSMAEANKLFANLDKERDSEQSPPSSASSSSSTAVPPTLSVPMAAEVDPVVERRQKRLRMLQYPGESDGAYQFRIAYYDENGFFPGEAPPSSATAHRAKETPPADLRLETHPRAPIPRHTPLDDAARRRPSAADWFPAATTAPSPEQAGWEQQQQQQGGHGMQERQLQLQEQQTQWQWQQQQQR